MASPTLFRTSGNVSLLKQATSFSRIAMRCSGVKVEKTSLVSPLRGSLVVLVAIRRKRTAEKDLVYRQREKSQSDEFKLVYQKRLTAASSAP